MQNNTFDFGRELGQTERLFFFFERVCFLSVCAWERRRDGQSCEAGRNGQNWWCSPLRIWVRCSLFTLVLLAPVTDLLSLCQVTERRKQRRPGTFCIKRGQKQSCSTLPLANHTVSFFCAICGQQILHVYNTLHSTCVYEVYSLHIFAIHSFSFFLKGAFWSSLYSCI